MGKLLLEQFMEQHAWLSSMKFCWFQWLCYNVMYHLVSIAVDREVASLGKSRAFKV